VVRNGHKTIQANTHLDIAVRKMRNLTNADVVCRGICNYDEQAFTLGEICGAQTSVLSRLSIRRGYGVGGKAMSLARPMAVRDYSRAQSISHQYDAVVAAEGLRAMFAIPVAHQSGVFGVLYGGFRAPIPIGDRILAPAVRVARDIESKLFIDEMVSRRLADIEKAKKDAAPADERSVARERLREIQAELLEIAHSVSDPSVCTQLRELARQLTSSEGVTNARRGSGRPLLSPREIDVLVQVAVGCSNSEIALRLSILPTTVKSYLKSAMRKLDAGNRVEAVCAARRLAIIP
jgi:DNA-binding NarL/FixJ family response regulator